MAAVVRSTPKQKFVNTVYFVENKAPVKVHAGLVYISLSATHTGMCLLLQESLLQTHSSVLFEKHVENDTYAILTRLYMCCTIPQSSCHLQKKKIVQTFSFFLYV